MRPKAGLKHPRGQRDGYIGGDAPIYAREHPFGVAADCAAAPASSSKAYKRERTESEREAAAKTASSANRFQQKPTTQQRMMNECNVIASSYGLRGNGT